MFKVNGVIISKNVSDVSEELLYLADVCSAFQTEMVY
jgi:hypothetical protein